MSKRHYSIDLYKVERNINYDNMLDLKKVERTVAKHKFLMHGKYMMMNSYAFYRCMVINPH